MNSHDISTRCWDQRTLRELRNGALRLTEEKTYDRFGRLSKIKSGSSEVIYYYNSFNQLEKRLINNVPEFYYYTKYGQLRAKTLGAEEDKNPLASLKYFYSRSGMIVAREVNGARQNYKYDKKYQLLGVYDDKGNAIEEYVYDPAGNILKKTIQGRTTTYKYDKANQLVSSECNGKVTKYEYDAAGRLVKEGDKEYHYIGLDKIESVTEGGQKLSSFTYHIDGQLAEAVTPEKKETFQWDGLALIQRNSTSYVNEPAVTGGNPILADDKVLFNDMLGTTLGVKDDDKVMQNNLTAFGESLSTSPMQDSFFTGKPHVGELGYAFLFRNYRADQGKWQTSDPLGYPDGWNNLAYVNNGVTFAIDWLGAWTTPSTSFSFSASLNYSSSINEVNGLKDLSVSYSWQNPTITDIVLPEPASPHVSSWYEYKTLRFEFSVTTYINGVQQSSKSHLWLFDGKETTWSPRGIFSDSISVSQKAKGDVIKIVFSGDVFCSLFFGSDNTYPSLGIYEERLDHIDKTFVVE